MSRLDDTISDVSYILDVLMAYRNIVQRGNCNTCKKKKEMRICSEAGGIGEI
jgi:hypothetical protein